MQVAKALNSPLEGLSKLNEAGVSFTAKQKETVKRLVEIGDVAGAQKVILAELAGEFGGAAAASTETFTGKVKQLQDRFGDVVEAIGGALIPIFEQLFPYIEAVAKGFEQIVPWAIQVVSQFLQIGEAGGFLANVLEGLVDGAVTYFSILEFELNNFGKIFELAMDTASLSVVTFLGQIQYTFTEVIPSLLSWFADNWVEIFTDIANYTGTILANMARNIYAFFSNVWKWLAGEEVSWEWKGLTEGFEATLKELPEIAERQKSRLEQALEADVQKTAAALAEEYQKTYDKNKEFVKELFEGEDSGAESESKLAAALENNASDKYEKSGTDKGVKASFESLEALSKRVTAAAASGEAVNAFGDAIAGQELPKEGEKKNEVAEAIKDLDNEAAKSVDNLIAVVQGILTKFPFVGVYG
jgi:hypothetical protein